MAESDGRVMWSSLAARTSDHVAYRADAGAERMNHRVPSSGMVAAFGIP